MPYKILIESKTLPKYHPTPLDGSQKGLFTLLGLQGILHAIARFVSLTLTVSHSDNLHPTINRFTTLSASSETLRNGTIVLGQGIGN